MGRPALRPRADRPAGGKGLFLLVGSRLAQLGSVCSCCALALALRPEASHPAGCSLKLFVKLCPAGTEGSEVVPRDHGRLAKGWPKLNEGAPHPVTHTSQPEQLLMYLMYLPSKISVKERITEPRKFEEPWPEG